MTQFHVDSDAVAHATATVAGSVHRIQAEVSTLRSQLSELQASWSGPAANAFQSTVDAWHQTQLRVEESLSTLNTALATAARHYAEMEIATTRLFSG
ncbi:MAG: WXG100 family type VII secretion target [Microbacteriaceae bacterium]|nr:WXG100 family type VII secretion target [Microbacteriaceae bacterium]